MKKEKNMDQNTDFVTANIENLVKTSKHMQNKMRQDLQTLSSSHVGFSEREGLPPIWDSLILNPYVKNVVADHIMQTSHQTHGTNRPIQSSVRTEQDMSISSREPHSLLRSHVQKIVEVTDSYSTQRSQSNVPTERSKENVVHTSALVSKIEKTRCSVKNSTMGYSKHNTKTKKLSNKQVPKKRELPLQRFAGSSLETIDFSKEHPNLELYTSPNQSTVFPRRLHKNLRVSSSHLLNSLNEISVNLAAAKMKDPTVTPPEIKTPHLLKLNEELYVKPTQRKAVPQVEEKTWKEVFMKNKSSEKPKKIHPKVANTVKVVLKKSPVVEEKLGIDIISTPYRGLYCLENEGTQLFKQKKCNKQRLPVMYIRPECQVQRVASISIYDDRSTNQDENTSEKVSRNVGYVECRHEDIRCEEEVNKTVTNHSEAFVYKLPQQIDFPKVEDVILTKNAKQPTVKSSNKFIDALESSEFLLSKSRTSYSFSQSGKFSLTSTVVDSLQSPTEASTYPTSSSTIETIEHNVPCGMKNKFTRSTQKPPAETFKSSVGVQYDPNEVYIKTINVKNPPPVDPPLPFEIPSLVLLEETARSTDGLTTSSAVEYDCRTHSAVVGNRRSQTYNDKSTFEDDFIGKIFERIRNDASDGLKEFKQRKHNHPAEADVFEKRERRRHRQENSMTRPFPRVELFLDDEVPEQSHQFSHRRDVEQKPVHSQSEKFNPKGGAEKATDNGKAKESPQKYPMEKEIKRAVKLFLDSLTSEKGDVYSGPERTLNLGREQRTLKFLRSEPASRTRLLNYDSSASSEKKSEWSMDTSPPYKEFNCFLQATESPSSSEIGSDSTEHSKEPMRSPILRSESLSEGEVLSIGEV